MRRFPAALRSGSFLAALLFCACASSSPVRHPTAYGFLADYSRLHDGGPGQAERVYIAPDVDWAKYDKILLDPVTIWRGTTSRSRGLSHEQARKLADYFAQLLFNDFSKEWQMVREPGPDTLRVSVALTKLDEEHVVLDVISSVVWQARVLDKLQSLYTQRLAFTGLAAIEARITDAETGRILAEGIDRRVGKHILSREQLRKWGDVQNIMEFWAERSVHNLCAAQGRENCPPLPRGA